MYGDAKTTVDVSGDDRTTDKKVSLPNTYTS